MMSETRQNVATADNSAADLLIDHPAPPDTATGVVVGVDDSLSARAAVAWAAAEAGRRGVGLHLVEALPVGVGGETESGVPHGRARVLLFRAQGIARATSPGLAVTMQTMSGRVGSALVSSAAHAGLLVVGSNGPGGPIPLSVGSILGHVIAHAECPVVLVPAATPRPRALDGSVLVALDGSADDDQVLDFAAETAHRAGAALVTVCAATHADGDEEQQRDVAVAARLRERFPGLTVRTESIVAPLEDALLHLHDAQLIVLASRRGRAGASSSWTRRFLPVLSSCPVAVVPTTPAVPSPRG
jgi:nucleotide-binding universal stress UspA family protein